MRRALALAAAGLLVLAACGGDGDTASDLDIDSGPAATTGGAHGGAGGGHGGGGHAGHDTGATCSPTGTTINVVASGTAFNSQCFAAPANTPFTLRFENKDSIAHNIVILESHTATDVMFRADGFAGPKTNTFNVPALKAGTFAFHCEFHPNRMLGTFVVK